MKFSLKSFNDLGKCSYGTLLEEFDTETDRIKKFKNFTTFETEDVEINSLEDLMPYLWAIPGVRTCDNVNHTSVAIFSSTEPWWITRGYTSTVRERNQEMEIIKQKLRKENNISTKES